LRFSLSLKNKRFVDHYLPFFIYKSSTIGLMTCSHIILRFVVSIFLLVNYFSIFLLLNGIFTSDQEIAQLSGKLSPILIAGLVIGCFCLCLNTLIIYSIVKNFWTYSVETKSETKVLKTGKGFFHKESNTLLEETENITLIIYDDIPIKNPRKRNYLILLVISFIFVLGSLITFPIMYSLRAQQVCSDEYYSPCN